MNGDEVVTESGSVWESGGVVTSSVLGAMLEGTVFCLGH